jgi:hypothetical protein
MKVKIAPVSHIKHFNATMDSDFDTGAGYSDFNAYAHFDIDLDDSPECCDKLHYVDTKHYR